MARSTSLVAVLLLNNTTNEFYIKSDDQVHSKKVQLYSTLIRHFVHFLVSCSEISLTQLCEENHAEILWNAQKFDW